MEKQLGKSYQIIEEGKNGRTIGYAEYGEEHGTGVAELGAILKRAKPIDLLIIMLGSNDLQARFKPNAAEITTHMQRLLDIAEQSDTGREGRAPAVLLVSPIAYGDYLDSSPFAMFITQDAPALMSEVRASFKQLARQRGLHYFDASTAVKASCYDKLHMSKEDHLKLAQALTVKVKDIFNI